MVDILSISIDRDKHSAVNALLDMELVVLSDQILVSGNREYVVKLEDVGKG